MKTIEVQVVPNSSKSVVISRGPGPWKIRLAAPPVDGKANEALIELLAEEFDCAKSLITVTKGRASKIKKICIAI